ncbi:polysaccharide biosynthesis protein [Pedobacter glucosidilyticus]|nr:oligosaccharide flippase family protein [Pedobacter glucosidilyticus]KHJ39080.1 polysaccharide biosynthesis protein [Pedobacter glucosidilyticus]
MDRKESYKTGTIGSQTIKGSIYSYLGIIIGFFSVTVLRSHGLGPEENGILDLILSFTMILAQLGSLGFFNASIRCFPYFRDETKNHNGFMFLLLAIPFVGLLLFTLLFYLGKSILPVESNFTTLFQDYTPVILALTLGTVLFNALDTFNRTALLDAVTGSTLKEFVQKLTVAIAMGLMLYFTLPFPLFLWIWVLANLIPTVWIFIKLYRKKAFNLKPDFAFLNPEMVKMLSSVSLFAVLTGFTTMIIQYIDKIMINEMINTSLTGIYSITAFFGTVVLMPSRIMYRIGGIIIAEKWKVHDIDGIKSVYKKSCINQLLIAMLIFIGIWANIDNVFEMIPKEYEAGKYVILFISLSGLIEMATGFNGVIIATSKYYKYDTYFFLALIFITIATNYIFIPIWGITGSAMATALATLLFNFFRYLFLVIKFKMQPMGLNNLFILMIGLFTLFIIGYLPKQSFFVWDIILRSGIITLVYVNSIYVLKLAPEMNTIIDKYKTKLLS